MAIPSDAALKIAKLARLDLKMDLKALDKLTHDFDRIVSYMDILSLADTTGVMPMYSPMIEPVGPREDAPLPPDPEKSEAILGEAPETVGRYFSVPRLF
ncbi:MAG: Asp-tRNA(Asn)/Glu-tRNA(Gln) amidotransferase subunit GatC [Deltaproteobacteria bacterium]|jgi:aspartyl-tRNA(Asn)/glutamyl-tRNA(Gln) amidotransferase subunit C|nr:Asp-tRNA(Asn)/Glu-tRNA(Gln) amidotransferase subunit GatC [Deltaproteobacteria bacterium]